MNYGGRLIALGSSSGKYPGEALLWTCFDGFPYLSYTVAVDLGKTEDMGRQVALAGPSILILTHDDWDHIGGWGSFRTIGLSTLHELWMPYEWGVLMHVLADLDSGESGHLDSSIEKEALASSAGPTPEEHDPDSGDELTERTIERAYDRARELPTDVTLVARLGTLLKRLRDDDSEPGNWKGTPPQVAKRAVSRAAHLTEIIRSASRAGTRIRYFSVDHAVTGELPPPWERTAARTAASLANAVEVRLTTPSRHTVTTLAWLLALTVQNRRALCPVLWSCHTLCPAVMVWSDSSGEWTGQFPGFPHLLRTVQVSTAPHHGSDNPAHDNAWQALAPFLQRPDSLVVLAGGEPSQRFVRQEYLNLPTGRRGCTRCRHLQPPAQSSQGVAIQVPSWHPANFLVGGCRV